MDHASGGVKDKAMEKVRPAVDKAKHFGSAVKEKAVAAKDAAVTAKEAVSAFVDEAKKNDLQGNVKQAVQMTGETVRDVSQTVKDETRQTKESFRGGSSSDTF